MDLIIKPDEKKFNNKKPYTEKVLENDLFIVIHFYLKKEQKIPMHISPSSVIVTVLKGKAKFFINNLENHVVLKQGETIKYNPQQPHGFESLEDTIIQAIIIPKPTQKIKINLQQG